MKTQTNFSRCISIVGPSQGGKTTLMESILHICKQIHNKGQVQSNNTLSDYLPEEHELNMSTSMGISNAQFMDEKFTFIDCPGSSDFINEFFKLDNKFKNTYSKKLFNFLDNNTLFKKYSIILADKGLS